MHELVDICVNFANKDFRRDEADVVARARDAGVTTWLVTGSTLADSRKGLRLAEAYPDTCYATVGIHPHHASDWDGTYADQLRALAGHAKVRALGEMGLDYNRNYSPPAVQRDVFEAQLVLACELGLPVFLHDREAHADFLPLIARYRDRLADGVVHCFTGTAEELDAYLDLDLHIGITGWICDERRGLHLRELVRRIPAERLMLETDAPYLLPRTIRPRPKSRRNEPAYLPWVVDAVAEARGEAPETVATSTAATARRFYRLPA